jgi:hypothetical protein
MAAKTANQPDPALLMATLSDFWLAQTQKIEALAQIVEVLQSQVQTLEDRQNRLAALEDENLELRQRVYWDSEDCCSVEDELQREYSAQRRGEAAG